MPPGPAVTGHPHEPVVQSAAATAPPVLHAAVPGGENIPSSPPR